MYSRMVTCQDLNLLIIALQTWTVPNFRMGTTLTRCSLAHNIITRALMEFVTLVSVHRIYILMATCTCATIIPRSLLANKRLVPLCTFWLIRQLIFIQIEQCIPSQFYSIILRKYCCIRIPLKQCRPHFDFNAMQSSLYKSYDSSLASVSNELL